MDITIVIPALNRKEYLRRTLESIPETYAVIVVDNGSTDGSYAWCQEYAKRRSNLYVASCSKAGAAAARNQGLGLCQSKWIYFFDSDDLFTGLPDGWDEQADLVCIPTRQQRNGRIKTRAYEAVATPHTHILNLMLNTQGMIFRTAFLQAIGGWDERCLIWDDWELGARALFHRPRVQWITKEAYHTIFVHANSLTGSDYSSRIDKIIETLRIVFEDIYDAEKNASLSSGLCNKAFAALFYRCHILCGQVQREGDEEAARKVRQFISERFQVNRQSQQMGQLLEWGAKKGVRGMWRIALWAMPK